MVEYVCLCETKNEGRPRKSFGLHKTFEDHHVVFHYALFALAINVRLRDVGDDLPSRHTYGRNHVEALGRAPR